MPESLRRGWQYEYFDDERVEVPTLVTGFGNLTVTEHHAGYYRIAIGGRTLMGAPFGSVNQACEAAESNLMSRCANTVTIFERVTGRTQAEVLALFDRAIAECESQVSMTAREGE